MSYVTVSKGHGYPLVIHNNLKEHDQAIAPAWKFWLAQFLTGTVACTGHVPSYIYNILGVHPDVLLGGNGVRISTPFINTFL